MIITPAEPPDLPTLLSFRQEAAAWLRGLGFDQWSRPYPADKLSATIEAGAVFMLRDGRTTAGTITLTPDAEDGLWTGEELAEPSMFVNKLTIARAYAGQNLGGRLLDWADDRAHHAGAQWLRLDALDHARSMVCGATADGMGAGVRGGSAGRRRPATRRFRQHAPAVRVR
ncbi:GNAT family N-acetyltransferase [Streptomyces sp. NWU339]|uniref:GNAT family N-acetyltransferase n=1 Tax=Streptomyces sp. NWU339 TaxID=2185284 RepID=UPI000D67A3F6|nr:GNAT family N-acetyltransferase [Streptomyces sp. NWU339]PWI05771.1 GNAT family N-acetyltransferase [Streptomyces sp. NWU339]